MGEGNGNEPIIVPVEVYKERLAQFLSGNTEGSVPVTTPVFRSASMASVEAAYERDRLARAARAAQSPQAVPIPSPNVAVAPIQRPIKSPEDIESGSVPATKERSRRSRKVGALAIAAVIAAAGLTAGATTGAIKLPGNISHVTSALANRDTAHIPGQVTALGAEGLNAQNCSGPEHAVADITISGRLPLKWLLMSADNRQIIPDKYMDQVATAMKKPNLKTDSGYPEMTADSYQYYMNICQANNKDAAATGSMINAQNLAITLTPVDASIVVQDQAYMTSLKTGENVTVPSQAFISSNPAAYTDASLKAVNDIATYAPGAAFENQVRGELNLMSDSIGNGFSSADPKSSFNILMGNKTIYDVEKQALEKLLGNDNLVFNGSMPAPTVGHTVGNEKAANLAPDDPNSPGFVPTEIQVKLGLPTIATASPTPTPTTTNGGNS